MTQHIKEYSAPEKEVSFQFLSEHEREKLDSADANHFIKLNTPDKNIPFMVLPNGGVIADITANNPKTIFKDLNLTVSSDKFYGAGFIEVYHGNKTLVFHRVESSIFEMQWRVDDIASALQLELDLYYHGYRIRSR